MDIIKNFVVVSRDVFLNDLLDTILQKYAIHDARSDSYKQAKNRNYLRRTGKKRGKYEYKGSEWSK